MNTLVINAGSSSLKYKLFHGDKELLFGHIDGIGRKGTSTLKAGNLNASENVHIQNYSEAMQHALNKVAKQVQLSNITAVLHRVVHGGERFTRHAKITAAVEAEIVKLCDLAPLHNPANLSGIREARKVLSHAEHIAFFDTAFHHTIPKHAFLYGIPLQFYEKWGIRKYGFHGLSHQYITQEVYSKQKDTDHLISCHLGSGSSIAAILHGKSIDTTMGFTPLDGLLMATRSGELDPDIPLFLMEHENLSVQDISNILNTQAGIKGLVGTADLREVKAKADAGDAMAKTVIQMVCYRIAQFIGSYHITVGGVHTLVFTGGIGEHADYVRSEVCKLLMPIGVILDENLNKKPRGVISSDASRVTVMVIPANEEQQMVNLYLAGEYER